jgi:hypothetical protein
MPKAVTIPEGVSKRDDGRWVRFCPTCENEVDHLRRNYAIHSHINEQPCKRCSNINNHPSGMHGPVRVAWFNSFRRSALSRGLEWELSVDDVASLYELQNGRCALSGQSIGWSEHGWNHTASVDRIDSSQGYTLFNVQLLHKDVNMMKQAFDQDYFVEVCRSIARNSE